MHDEHIKQMQETINPSGWMIQHFRCGSTCNFGPFSDLQEAVEWWERIGEAEGVSPNYIALFRDVDWNRR